MSETYDIQDIQMPRMLNVAILFKKPYDRFTVKIFT